MPRTELKLSVQTDSAPIMFNQYCMRQVHEVSEELPVLGQKAPRLQLDGTNASQQDTQR